MAKENTPQQAGGPATATLPRMSERLQMGPGDRMLAIETPRDLDFHDALKDFAEVRRQYRNTLKKLAG